MTHHPTGQAGRSRFTMPGTTALRFRDFRLFWFGFVSEVSGQQILWVAQGWLIYELSGSALLLGVAGIARAIPSTLLTFLGGALADKLDQRRLLMGVQLVQICLLTSLGFLATTGTIAVWHLLVIISISAAVEAFEQPARQAIFPRLVPRTALMDAVSLNAIVYPGTRFAGPFLGGLLMAQVRIMTGNPLLGPATLFFLTAFGYGVNYLLLYVIRLEPVLREEKVTSVLTDMANGVKFIALNPIFASLILMTYATQFFGWSFQSLFPVFSKDIFGGGEFELGLMGSVLGAGSLLGAITASNLASVERRGLLIIGGFVAPASLIIVFSAVQVFWIALLMLFLIGVTQAVFNVSAQSTLHYLVPNEYRGRVMGIWGMTHTAVMPTGQLLMGVVAGILSAPLAVAGGGAAMLLYALVFALPDRRLRTLTFTADDTEEAALVRLRA